MNKVVYVAAAASFCLFLAITYGSAIDLDTYPTRVGWILLLSLCSGLVLMIAIKIVGFIRRAWYDRIFILVAVATVDYLVFFGFSNAMGAPSITSLSLLSEHFQTDLLTQKDAPRGFYILWAVLIVVAAVVCLGKSLMASADKLALSSSSRRLRD